MIENQENLKKQCKLCFEKKNKDEILNSDCCKKRICLKCLKSALTKELNNQIKVSHYDHTLKCPNCGVEIRNDKILKSSLGYDDYQKYQIYFLNKRRCKMCKTFKEKNDIFKIPSCKHRICTICLHNVFSNLKISNLQTKCPLSKCSEEFIIPQELFYEGFRSKNEKNNENFENIENIKNIESKNGIIEKNFIQKNNMQNSLSSYNNFLCQICNYEKPVNEMINLQCGHPFCKFCIIEYSSSKIDEGAVSQSQLFCPGINCKKPLDYFLLKENLSRKVFEKYDFLLTKQSISQIKTVSCPKCQLTYQLEKETNFFLCNQCKTEYCSNEACLKPKASTKQNNCDCVKKTNVEDKIFQQYVTENNLKKCPVCRIYIEKSRNCNYIRCLSQVCQGKTTFCYLCGEKLDPKNPASHFLNNSLYSRCVSKKNEVAKEVVLKKEYNHQENRIEKKANNNFEKKNSIFRLEECLHCKEKLLDDNKNHYQIFVTPLEIDFLFICCKNSQTKLFCLLCLLELSFENDFLEHLQSHTKDSINIKEIQGIFKPEDFKNKKKKKNNVNSENLVDDRLFSCYYCKNKQKRHLMFEINGFNLPLCKKNKFPFLAYCKECKNLISINEVKNHYTSFH